MNSALSPSGAERAWAERVLAAMHEGSAGAVVVDGKMVDLPILKKAERLAAAPDALVSVRKDA